jgi:hypothetical protein
MKKGMRTLAMVGLGGGLGLSALVGGPARARAQEGMNPQQQTAPAQPTGPLEPEPPPPAGQQPAQPAPGGAEKQAAKQPTTEKTETTKMTATVEKVDVKDRKVSLRDPEGQSFQVQVPEGAGNLQNLKKGDKVDLTYTESLAVALLPPGQAAPPTEERQATGHEMGGGQAARQVTAAITITAVDTANNTVSFKAPDGSKKTVKVEDPDMQQRLATLKPGDRRAADVHRGGRRAPRSALREEGPLVSGSGDRGGRAGGRPKG